MELRVQRVQKLTETTLGIWLEAVSGSLPGFSAGAHLDLWLKPDLMRQYSLCNPSASPAVYQLAVLLEADSRGGSIAVSQLQVGDLVESSEPRNNFELNDAESYRLFAAGVGITPIWAMVQELNTRSLPYQLFYRTKSPELTAFRDELAVTANPNSVVHSYSLTEAIDIVKLVANPGSKERLYVCGPQRFIDPILEAAKAAGWRSDQLHREYFSADGTADTSEDHSFRVRVAATGDEYEVPAGRSIAAVLEEAGHFVPLSCEEGICGTCLVPVIEGTPDHRDLYMSEKEHAENDMITLCCSRSKSDLLVVDL